MNILGMDEKNRRGLRKAYKKEKKGAERGCCFQLFRG